MDGQAPATPRMAMGSMTTLIAGARAVPRVPVPKDHLVKCRARNILVTGSASGNTDDPLNTMGFITTPLTN
ncbi:Cupredoxin [Apiospora phragmitis]|uniref:Cupredoxin n=1 Tax=Apiospora phragmitis TaxID=2905665 RepID=A0ABR1TRR9_9PEZI